jgi:Cys-tRNA(Pro)/Cys-tRNA(Cys) deacylase
MKLATKTNAVRLVQAAGIPCREAFYAYDENDLNGNHAAVAMGFPPEQVYKTLVAKGERTGIHVFCIPVCCELDLKKAAKAAGDKNIQMLAVKELLYVTGYIRGGCSPVGMKKKYRTVFDATAQDCETMLVSAGRIGWQIEAKPADLAAVSEAIFVDILLEKP